MPKDLVSCFWGLPNSKLQYLQQALGGTERKGPSFSLDFRPSQEEILSFLRQQGRKAAAYSRLSVSPSKDLAVEAFQRIIRYWFPQRQGVKAEICSSAEK